MFLDIAAFSGYPTTPFQKAVDPATEIRAGAEPVLI
jgi:hypothetical protein